MERILFDGYALTEDEFIIKFKQKWKNSNWSEGLKQEIINLQKQIKKKDTSQNIISQWEKIEKNYFSNPEVDVIMSIVTEKEGRLYSTPVSEKTQVGKKTLSIGLSKIKNSYVKTGEELDAGLALSKAKEISEKINNHYKTLIQSLSKNPNKNDIETFNRYYQGQKLDDLAARLNLQRGFLKHQLLKDDKTLKYNILKQKTYNEIIYGNMKTAEGKKLDAYFNHLGAHHTSLFYKLKHIDSKTVFEDLSKTVKSEEKNNFAQRLLDSMDTISWYAGGDIVVVNAVGQIIYNIQLKTSINKSQSFQISVSNLEKFTQKFLKELESPNSYDNLAKLIYNELKNSVIVSLDKEFTPELEQIVLDDLKKTLTK